MKSDVFVDVTCDVCKDSEKVKLTSLAGRGCWDERNVDAELKRDGWSVDGDKHKCVSCVEDQAL